MSDIVRGMSPEAGGLSPTDVVNKARAHFGGSAFKDGDFKSLLTFAMAVPAKLVDMLQALHFALVSPAQLRLPAKAFANIAALSRDFPYSKATPSAP